MLASGVLGTLVLIDTESSTLIEFESSRTDTSEASKGIDTSTRFGTSSVLLAFIYVYVDSK